MTKEPESPEELRFELERLSPRLEEAEATLQAIRNGEVDALVVRAEQREQVFTLRGAEHTYRLLIETMNEGALTVIADGTILYSNRRFAAMVKTPLQKVIGASVRQFVVPAELPALNALLEQGGQGSQGEVALRAGDGARVPVLVSINTVPMDSAERTCTVVVTDLSEQKRNEAIVAAEKLARSILDQAAEAIVVCDHSGQVIRASQVAHQLCERNPILQPFELAFPLLLDGTSAVGAPLVGAHEGRERRFSVPDILGGQSLHGVEATLSRSDGGRVDLLLSAGPLSGGENEILGCVVTLTDISARKRLEEELRQRAEELAAADRRKDEFLAMLAHELRNPLGASSNALQLMRRLGTSDPALQRATSVIERQVQHQVRIVDDLLDVSRVSRGKIALQREWRDLAWVIRHTGEDHRPAFEAAGLTLLLELPQEPVWFAGDRTRLTQVLANLLTNAAKFTNAGGQVTIRLTTDADGSQAALTVGDTGIGIDPQMLPHVFESFAQADRSLDRSRGGLGLGLALVKGLIELHGGVVRADSPGLGCGAEFSFTLPLEPVSAPYREVAVCPDPPVRCCRILVVEDNRDAAETLRDVLELSGHEVMLAFSGPEGVAAARRVPPEVVLCDIGLPGFDGYAVAQALRQDPVTAAARLIALTGYGHEEDRCRSQEAGFERYLVKPVNLAALEGLLAALPAARLP